MQNHIEYKTWLVREKVNYLQFIPKDVHSVLDVGCGRGELLYLLKRKSFEVQGCDIDGVCLKKSAHFAQVKKANASELSQVYSKNSFDLVTCIHVLEHTLHPLITLQQLKRVTKKYILLAVPNARYIAHNERATHLYRWNGDTFRNLLEKAELKVLMLKQDRTNMFPNVLRLTPIINRIILKIFIGPNELVALCQK